VASSSDRDDPLVAWLSAGAETQRMTGMFPPSKLENGRARRACVIVARLRNCCEQQHQLREHNVAPRSSAVLGCAPVATSPGELGHCHPATQPTDRRGV